MGGFAASLRRRSRHAVIVRCYSLGFIYTNSIFSFKSSTLNFILAFRALKTFRIVSNLAFAISLNGFCRL